MRLWATYHAGDDSVVLWEKRPTVHTALEWRGDGCCGWIGVEVFKALFGRVPKPSRPERITSPAASACTAAQTDPAGGKRQ
jgi:hypothetical protein